jgi:hypothetical protein
MPDMVHTVMPTDIYQPSPLRHHLLHRIARDARRALPHLTRRAVSAMLRLSWQLDITVIIDADVFADDRASTATMFERHLPHPDTRLVAYGPSLGPIGWRDIATVSITDIRDVTVTETAPRISMPYGTPALWTRSASPWPPAISTPTCRYRTRLCDEHAEAILTAQLQGPCCLPRARITIS